jgi:hypothetical protein
MTKLLGIGVVFQVVACAIVGVRLLMLAARTRQAPELFLGASFLLLGAIGYPLSIVARSGGAGELSSTLLLSALAAQNLACFCMFLTTALTFYPRRHPRARFVRVVLALTGSGFAASLAGSHLSASIDAGPWYYLGFSLRAAAFAWAAVESHRLGLRLQRRLRIGLGDVIVADRFRLWTISTAAITAGFAVFLAGRLLGVNVGTSPAVLIATSLVSLVSGTSMWLAFFPPTRYATWVVAQAPEPIE